MNSTPRITSIAARLVVAAVIFPAGCGRVKVRDHSHVRAIADLVGRPVEARRHDSLDDMVLERAGIAGDEGGALESAFEGSPRADLALALAERRYRDARRAEGISGARAIALYRDAAAYASVAVAIAGGGQGPELDRAVQAHNSSLAHLIRAAQEGFLVASRDRPTDWRATLGRLGIGAAGPPPQLDPGRVMSLTEAADYRVVGLDHRYTSAGLGVPLVARSANDRDRFTSFQDKSLPEKLAVAATAILRVGGVTEGGPWRGRSLTLQLVDPFTSRVVLIGGQTLPLAADRTAAMAVQFDGARSLERAAFQATLSSTLVRYDAGVYMLQPYRRGKIPVVLVHGLISSPLVWAEAMNELSNDPALAEHYQIWAFLYATGEPIPLAAVAAP